MRVVLVTSILLLAYVSVSRNRKQLGDVPTPCIKVCRLEDGYCVGCKRTPEEIRDWMIMSTYEQNMLVHELKWRQENGS